MGRSPFLLPPLNGEEWRTAGAATPPINGGSSAKRLDVLVIATRRAIRVRRAQPLLDQRIPGRLRGVRKAEKRKIGCFDHAVLDELVEIDDLAPIRLVEQHN